MSLKFKIFEDYSNITYGLSEKRDGPMELASNLKNQLNRTLFAERQSFNLKTTAIADLAHSNKVARVESGQGTRIFSGTDGLLTTSHNTILTITVADCFPIYFYDPRNKAVGLIHCGWKGAVKNIAKEMAESFVNFFNSDRRELIAAIGPGIRPCHFEIQTDILNQFERYPQNIIAEKGRLSVDLPGIIKAQLLQNGFYNKNIEDCGICTYCNYQKYFSFRRDNPQNIQAMLGYIGLI